VRGSLEQFQHPLERRAPSRHFVALQSQRSKYDALSGPGKVNCCQRNGLERLLVL
jgi:hypothetical protein